MTNEIQIDTVGPQQMIVRDTTDQMLSRSEVEIQPMTERRELTARYADCRPREILQGR